MAKTKTETESTMAPEWIPILTGPDAGCYIARTGSGKGEKNGHAYTMNEEGTGWIYAEETIPNGL